MNPADSPMSVGLGWLLAALLFLLICAVIANWRRAPYADEGPSHLDALDGVGARCQTCARPATVNVHAGHDWWHFCKEHAPIHLTAFMRNGGAA